MISQMKLDFSQVPSDWKGYPVHYKIINQALEQIADGSITMDTRASDTSINIDSTQTPPGNYLFTVRLPSGKTLMQPFQIETDKQTTLLVPYDNSPHEWLGSQTLLGHSLNLKQYTTLLEKFSGSDPIAKAANASKMDWQFFYPQFSNKSILLYKSDMSVQQISDAFHLILSFGGQNFDRSTVAELRIGGSVKSVMLPPLSRREQHDVLSLDLYWATPDITSIDQVTIGVNLQNKRAQALLSYMKLGDIESAQKVSGPVIEEAQQMFKDKMLDLGAALAAAYLLTRTSAWTRMPLDWCDNLSNFFPYISDGAIINAHRQIVELKSEVSSNDLARIAQLLITAVDRGIPIFSAGLRLLNDDLQALKNSIEASQNSLTDPKAPVAKQLADTLKEVTVACKRVANYLRYSDFSNSFTTLTFSNEEAHKVIFTYQ